MAKIIVIEGTDCSGKETQSKKLIERLTKDNIAIQYFCFPNYDSPTGKIVGGPYLGKKHVCGGYFEEGASYVDPQVSSLYYAADRKYNIPKILDKLNNGINVVLDRYTYSNMAHQGGKILDKSARKDLYKWIENLEFDLLNLPKADIKIFLHMPTDIAKELRKNREELDQHESNIDHLYCAEKAYLEIAQEYDFITIECSNNNQIRSVDDIGDEVYEKVKKLL